MFQMSRKVLLDTGYALRYPKRKKGLRVNSLVHYKVVRCNVIGCHEGVVATVFMCAEPVPS